MSRHVDVERETIEAATLSACVRSCARANVYKTPHGGQRFSSHCRGTGDHLPVLAPRGAQIRRRHRFNRLPTQKKKKA